MENTIAKYVKSELAKEIKREYRILLSEGISDAAAEEMIVDYFFSDVTETEKGQQWISLALIQWTMGRLSAHVHAMAKQWIIAPELAVSLEEACAINALLNSPMPERKTVPRIRPIKCPWEKGSLLAYQITTCEKKSNSRFWGKYVLLRVVEIKRWPLSNVLPDLVCDESMYVALYNWVGNEVPKTDITGDLEFTHISILKPLLPQFPNMSLEKLYNSVVSNGRCNMRLNTAYTNYVYALDWGNKKTVSEVFSKISENVGCAEAFHMDQQEKRIPPMAGTSGFDIVLIKRLEELFPE